MAASIAYPGRFAAAPTSMASLAAAQPVRLHPAATDLADAWAIMFQACDGQVLRTASGVHIIGHPYTCEPISEIVGRTHLRLDTEDEVAGARKVLMAMIDLCDRETRDAVFALAGER